MSTCLRCKWFDANHNGETVCTYDPPMTLLHALGIDPFGLEPTKTHPDWTCSAFAPEEDK